jgi:hypothetical protein
MKFIDFATKFANLVVAANDEKTWYDGYEPPVSVYRRDLDLDIPIKEIEFSGGKVRIVV